MIEYIFVNIFFLSRFESKGTQFLKSLPTHPIGLAPDDVAKMEKAKKAAAEAEASSSTQHMSKAAKKNAKRKEKKKQDKTADSVTQVTQAVQKVDIKESIGDECQKAADVNKKIKNLRKKLKQIEELEKKITSGELKAPEKDQLEKIARKQVIIDEIEDLELELDES